MTVAIIDPSSRTIVSGDIKTQMTRARFAVFDTLLRAKGRVLDYAFLWNRLEEATGHETFSGKALAVHVCRLRKEIAPHGFTIETRYEIGYRMPKVDHVILPDVELEFA